MTCDSCLNKYGCSEARFGESVRCMRFKDETEWFHLPCKDCETAYYPLGYGNKAQVIEEPIYGFAIKNGKHYIIDECGDFYEIGEEVFLTKEEAQKVVERRKNQ